ncbi:hypothetical protein E2562_017269, partial [Oryza meyeriana var. granulata]
EEDLPLSAQGNFDLSEMMDTDLDKLLGGEDDFSLMDEDRDLNSKKSSGVVEIDSDSTNGSHLEKGLEESGVKMVFAVRFPVLPGCFFCGLSPV